MYDETKAITKELDPNAVTKTHYGKISNRVWLMAEMERIVRSTGKKCMIHNTKGKQVLLYV